MPPRRRVRRLGDIALVHVARLVGQRIVELVRRCDPKQFHRHVVFIKNNICICVPPPMFNKFAILLLQTITRAIRSAELTKLSCIYSMLESPIMTLIDRVDTIEPLLGVSKQLMLLLYTNLHRFKMLTALEINHLDTYSRFQQTLIESGKPSTWLTKCNLRHLQTLLCPSWFFDEKTFLVRDNYSKLKILKVYNTGNYRETLTRVFNAIRRLSGLREVRLYRWGNMSSDGVTAREFEELLTRNPQLEILEIVCKLEIFLESDTIYTSLRQLFIHCEYMHNSDLETVAERFPNLTALKLFTRSSFDPWLVTLFPCLDTLGIFTRISSLDELWTSLTEVGHNIVSLELSSEPILPSDLYFIYEHCKNCENLVVLFASYDITETLIVPPFQKLKRLDLEVTVVITPEPNIRDFLYTLDFTRMPSLEYLHYSTFDIPPTRFEAILLDTENFPCLTEIVTHWITWERMRTLRRLVKQRNLEVSVSPE